jgi:predicted transcriptional regulator YheO
MNQYNKNRESLKMIKLSINDKKILNIIDPIVEGIAKLFGKNCEVVLHSLDNLQHSIIKIKNGEITGRKLGSPLTDLSIKILKEVNSSRDNVRSYYTKTKDAKILKSVTVLIRNSQEKPIGFLCINFNLSTPLTEFVQEIFPRSRTLVDTLEYFPVDTNELINRTLGEVVTKIAKKKDIPNTDKNKLIVFELYNKGIFNIKGTIDLVAKEIGVSRYTIYNYIRETKVKQI